MTEYLVIGLNAMGRTLALKLTRLGCEVTAADLSERRLDMIKDLIASAPCLDATNKEALESLNPRRFEAVIVCMGHRFEDAERTTLALKDLKVKRVINVATTKSRRKILAALGSDLILTPGLVEAESLAIELSDPLIHRFRYTSRGFGHAEIKLPSPLKVAKEELAEFFGAKIRFMGLASTDERERETVDLLIDQDLDLQRGDRLLLFGSPEDLSHFAAKRIKHDEASR